MQEVFLPVIGFEYSYEISNYGNLKSKLRTVASKHANGRIIKAKEKKLLIKPEGYAVAHLYKNCYGKSFYIHRLVAEAFIANPLGLNQVNHIDGNKLNNHVDNLEWVNCKENCIHALQINLYQSAKGEQISSSKLTENQVIDIRKLHATRIMHKDIAALFPVGRKAITKIVNRQRWKHV